MWAPAAFLGVEVNKMAGANANGGYHRLSTDANVEMVSMDHGSHQPSLLRVEHGPDDDVTTSSTGELSGIYFGILNIYTTVPQFVGTFISSIVFAILEPGKSPELATDAHPSEHHSTDGPNAISVCLFIGAFSTFGAAYATWRLRSM